MSTRAAVQLLWRRSADRKRTCPTDLRPFFQKFFGEVHTEEHFPISSVALRRSAATRLRRATDVDHPRRVSFRVTKDRAKFGSGSEGHTAWELP